MQNKIKIYVDLLGNTFKKENMEVKGEGINSDLIQYIMPFDITWVAEIVFNFNSAVPSQRYVLINSGETEEVEVTPNVFETWNVWHYAVSQEVSGIAVSDRITQTDVQAIMTDFADDSDFLGTVDTDPNVGLPTYIPTPVEGNYVRVLATSTDWEFLSDVWVDSETQLATVTQSIPSDLEELAFLPAIVGAPKVVLGDEALILQWIATKLSITTAEALYLLKEFRTSYPIESNPEADDYFILQKITGENKAITFADIVEGAADNFVGTFAIASGLACPDATDLLCVYPDGIGDPNDRLGWVANVTATNSVWRWITASNEWQDTLVAPSLAKDIGYNPTNDPSTNETNIQDGMVEHGEKIKANEDAIEIVENKTQKLNSDGDIAEDIEVITGKDIESPDIVAGTTYAGIIEAILAYFTRIGDNETNISTNSDDILTKLQKDFSTLGSVVLEGADLFVIRDDTDGINKKVSLTELASKIEGIISNDQGWYANLAALKSAIPVGENGWYATIGDTDTMGIWDSDSTDWLEVASKLYYTVGAGVALEGRVTINEGAISDLVAALTLKFDKANLTDDIIGNSTDSTKATTPKGVFDYVNRIDLLNEADRKYSTMIQAPVTADFYINSADTVLVNGRIEYVHISAVSPEDADARFSVDGGSTYKNLAIANGVNFNPSQSVLFGNYYEFMFNATFDKWVVLRTDLDFIEITGLDIGWTPDKTIQGNYADNQVQDTRISALEGGSLSGKSFIRQILATSVPITVATIGGLNKITLDVALEDSNDEDVITVDGNGDAVLVVEEAPGYELPIHALFTNTSAPSKAVQITLYIFDESGPISIGNEIDKLVLNTLATGLWSDRFIITPINEEDYVFPLTLGLYYENDVIDGVAGDLEILDFTQKSLFTGVGVSSSDNVALSTPSEETRGGVLPNQSDHNKESVIDRENLLEAGNVVVATDQGSGQYLANKPEIVLDTNKIVRVLFSGSGSDLTDLVELSLDNGSNYYDVEYRLTDVDLTVKNAVTHVMDLYFTGAKFIATYVDSPIENQDLPYVGLSGRLDTPKNEVPVYVGEEIAEVVQDYKGGTIENIIVGNFDSLGNWIGNATSVSDNELTVTGDGTRVDPRTWYDGNPLIDGVEYDFYAEVMVTNSDCIKLELRVDSGAFVIDFVDNPLINTWYVLKGTHTANSVATIYPRLSHVYADAGTANGKVMKVNGKGKGVLVIPIDNTFLEGLTADQINNRIDSYIDGLQSVKDITIESRGNNKFDINGSLDGNAQYTAAGAVAGGGGTNSAQLDYLPVIPNTDYYVATNDTPIVRRLVEYDINLNIVAVVEIPTTWTTTANTSFVRFHVNTGDFDWETTQLELGTVATEYEEFKKANAHINEELGDVPSAVDDFSFVRTKPYELQEADITAITTGTFVDWVTVLTSVFDGIKTQVSGVIDGSFRIVGFPTEISLGLDTAGNEYHFNTTDTGGGSLFLAFESGKYANLAAAKADLAGTKIRYQLETPLPRDGVLVPLLDMTGNLITGPGYTYTQASSSGITNEFKATTAVNTKSQIRKNTDAIVDIFKALIAVDGDLDKAISDIGDILTLTTTAKDNLVAAINELVTKIGDLTTLTTTEKSNLVGAINEIVGNLSTNYYNKTEIDNQFIALMTGLDWKETVANFAAIASTYPTPDDGWTVNVEDTDLTYRYDGTDWIKISSNSIPLATDSVDGLMVKTDKEKIDTIETGAEVNQSDAEIKTAYENNSNTNAFSDAEKTKLGKALTNVIVTSTRVNVSNSVSDPGSNGSYTDITLYKNLLVGFSLGTTGNVVIYREIKVPTVGNSYYFKWINIMDDTTMTEYSFRLKLTTSTTYTAYVGQKIITTFGATASVLNTADANIDIVEIIGLDY